MLLQLTVWSQLSTVGLGCSCHSTQNRNSNLCFFFYVSLHDRLYLLPSSDSFGCKWIILASIAPFRHWKRNSSAAPQAFLAIWAEERLKRIGRNSDISRAILSTSWWWTSFVLTASRGVKFEKPDYLLCPGSLSNAGSTWYVFSLLVLISTFSNYQIYLQLIPLNQNPILYDSRRKSYSRYMRSATRLP